jgi:ABC-type sugar transport system substrate-binding protein
VALSLTGPFSRSSQAAPTHAKSLKFGYVLHILIPFTAEIAEGAKDAAADYHASISVVGPPAFSAPTEISDFNAFVQQHVNGIGIVPNPPEAYPNVIKKALKAGVLVVTANVLSHASGVPWVGQDEYRSGIILARRLLAMPNGLKGKKGDVVIGSCAPGVSVLTARYNGIMKVLRNHPALHVVGPAGGYNVTGNPATNYSAWQSLYTAHRNAVAMIGLCALDNPDLATLKRKYHAHFAAAGYDITTDTLNAIKQGLVNLSIGQNPYLQGYLPIKAMADHLLKGRPMIKGWINCGTEVVTRANVNFYLRRESSHAVTRSFYAKQIHTIFANLNRLDRPLPTTF